LTKKRRNYVSKPTMAGVTGKRLKRGEGETSCFGRLKKKKEGSWNYGSWYDSFGNKVRGFTGHRRISYYIKRTGGKADDTRER